jgi:hypothetical protein
MVPEFLLFLFAQSHHVYTTGTSHGRHCHVDNK